MEFTWRSRELWWWFKNWLISGNLAKQFLCWNKVLLLFYCVLRDIHSRFCSKTQWQMFLLVSGCHVGAHPAWRLHTNLYKFGEKVSPHIFHKKNCCDLNVGESLCIFTFFLFPDSRLNLLNGFDFRFLSILNSATLKTKNYDWSFQYFDCFSGTTYDVIAFLICKKEKR